MRAVVSTVYRQRPSLDTWIDHHLKYFDCIILFIDDHSKIDEFKYGDARIAIAHGFQSDHSNRISRILANQKRNTDVAIGACKVKNIEWLLHVDDDELFFPFDEKTWEVEDDVDVIYFSNFEVLQTTSTVSNIFTDVTPIFKVNPLYQQKSGYKYLATQKGKCAVRPSSQIEAAWTPHAFIHTGQQITSPHAIILHYPSVDFQQWLQKFRNLGSFSDYWWDNPNGKIVGDDAIQMVFRDAVQEADQTNDYTRAFEIFCSTFPHEEHVIKELLAQGLLIQLPLKF